MLKPPPEKSFSYRKAAGIMGFVVMGVYGLSEVFRSLAGDVGTTKVELSAMQDALSAKRELQALGDLTDHLKDAAYRDVITVAECKLAEHEQYKPLKLFHKFVTATNAQYDYGMILLAMRDNENNQVLRMTDQLRADLTEISDSCRQIHGQMTLE